MNDRPDYVTENWLRCLGLSGKAAKAVMDVHTDQLNALRKDRDRLRWLHTGGGSGARKEWGVAEVEFDANGKVIGALWGFSDSSDIDKVMAAEFADEPRLAMNRPETYGLPPA